ncbi:MAG: restriction endonuclease subunit S [Gemmataceae bacterium]|nr:restriction endonuclease subunit S [Gemmataceae bacterium]
MGEWPAYPLSDFVDPDRSICYGIVQPGSPTDAGIPIVRVNNIRDGRIEPRDALKIAPSIEEKYRRSRLRGGELLVTLVGTMGLSAIVPEELRGWNVARAVGVVPLRSGVDKRWINFVIRSAPSQAFIQTHANTTVQATFNLRDLARLPIPMPPDDIRTPVSELLAALDDKIELSRRTNETLEALARAIFRDWFVDFGPTRAKAEGRAPYLAPEIWNVFPDAIDDETSAPSGWPIEPLYDQAEWVNGAAYKNMHFSDAPDALPVVKIAELKAGVTTNTKRTNTALGDKYRIDSGDLLFSWSGNPDTSIDAFIWVEGPAWLNQHIFAVRPNGKQSKAMLFVMLKNYIPEFAEIARNKQTTGLGHVTKADMQGMTICPGSNEARRAFDQIAGPLFEHIVTTLFESQTLVQTRDLLLPKLMSGQIRLCDAEKQVEAVA